VTIFSLKGQRSGGHWADIHVASFKQEATTKCTLSILTTEKPQICEQVSVTEHC